MHPLAASIVAELGQRGSCGSRVPFTRANTTRAWSTRSSRHGLSTTRRLTQLQTHACLMSRNQCVPTSRSPSISPHTHCDADPRASQPAPWRPWTTGRPTFIARWRCRSIVYSCTPLSSYRRSTHLLFAPGPLCLPVKLWP